MNNIQLINITQTAQILGISPKAAYRLAEENRLPGLVRIGRTLRVDPRKLNDFIESGGQPLS